MLLLALLSALGCPAVYPELATRLRAPAPGQVLTPPPPEDLRWIRFLSARIPERTRDGRRWDQSGGSLPDPYARLLVNGNEVLRTKVQSDTLEPTWPDGPSGNFIIKPDDQLRVELWDNHPINDRPIGIREIGRPAPEHRSSGRIPVELEGGARLELAFEPGHAKVGLGLWYELRTSTVSVSRTMASGPAERAGVKRGDQILAIGGREVRTMTPGQVRSAFNSVPVKGIVLQIMHASGAIETVTVVEGPVYPTFDQYGAVD
jgi:hypothetical protein